jgi:hypothetical protein
MPGLQEAASERLEELFADRPALPAPAQSEPTQEGKLSNKLSNGFGV